MRRRRLLVVVGAAVFLTAWPTLAWAPRMTGQPRSFPRSVQTSPAIAVDLNPNHHPGAPILAVGANDTFDQQACSDQSCAFTPYVGISGIFFSLDGGTTWSKPLYRGWTARKDDRSPGFGPIRTLPQYYGAGLVTRGDPSLAFGPSPSGAGGFSWHAGSELYYATIVRDRVLADEGRQAIAVSVTDDAEAAAAGMVGRPGSPSPWRDPRVVSDPAEVLADKPSVWADNAASSPFFGRAYVCWATFPSNDPDPRHIGADPTGSPLPIRLTSSGNGGRTWAAPIDLPVPTGQTGGRQGCSVRTDSAGAVYVFWEEYDTAAVDGRPTSSVLMARSTDGGQTFAEPLRTVVDGIRDVGRFDPGQGAVTFDGAAGSRTNSWPSVSIANCAPTGQLPCSASPGQRFDGDARIVVVWPDARNAYSQALLTFSDDGGASWSRPRNAARKFEYPDFPAVAISPNGEQVYLTYDTFRVGVWNEDSSKPRLVEGVTRRASFSDLERLVDAPDDDAAWHTDHVAEAGDARGSSNIALTAEYIGDYNGAAATDANGFAVWTDLAIVHHCPQVDDFRDNGGTLDLPVECRTDFGGSDVKTRVIPPG